MRLILIFVLCALVSWAEDWNRFRGPNGSGVAAGKGFPALLSKSENLLWRTAVRPGKSSPVLTAKHVFLTAAEGGKLFTQCFDRSTGKLLWERFVQRPHEEQVNALNHSAAISPVTDGENIYSFFKEFGLISYDASGKLRWKVALGPFTNVMGLGASPILTGDAVVIAVDQIDNSYLAAFDRRNGEMRWKVARDEFDAWGTPLAYTPAGGEAQVLTAARGQFGVHLAASGKRLLTAHDIPTTIVGSPVLVGDTVYMFGYGSDTPAPFAARLEKLDKNKDGQLTANEYGSDSFLRGIAKYSGNRDGIITKEKWDAKQRDVMGPNGLMALRLETGKAPRELWRYDKSFTAVIPTLLVYDEVLYVMKNGGILTAFDARSGAVLKTGRLDGGGGYSSSPVAADGKLYIASEEGIVTVLQAGRDWQVLNTIDLGEPCFATPALSEGSVYVRTGAGLYRFGRAGSR